VGTSHDRYRSGASHYTLCGHRSRRL
jgi:hypothetical protein